MSAHRPNAWRRFGAVTTMVVATWVGSCGGDSTGPVAASISAGASGLILDGLGVSHQLVATVSDQKGATISTAAVVWTTSAANVATVSPTGLVTAVGVGTASITAKSGTVSASVGVTVRQTPT